MHERTETLVGALLQHIRVERTVFGFESVLMISLILMMKKRYNNGKL
jgi:hypothetical protein